MRNAHSSVGNGLETNVVIARAGLLPGRASRASPALRAWNRPRELQPGPRHARLADLERDGPLAPPSLRAALAATGPEPRRRRSGAIGKPGNARHSRPEQRVAEPPPAGQHPRRRTPRPSARRRAHIPSVPFDPAGSCNRPREQGTGRSSARRGSREAGEPGWNDRAPRPSYLKPDSARCSRSGRIPGGTRSGLSHRPVTGVDSRRVPLVVRGGAIAACPSLIEARQLP